MEIAPAFQLDPHLRDRLHADAVNLARQVRIGHASDSLLVTRCVFNAPLTAEWAVMDGGLMDVNTVECVCVWSCFNCHYCCVEHAMLRLSLFQG